MGVITRDAEGFEVKKKSVRVGDVLVGRGGGKHISNFDKLLLSTVGGKNLILLHRSPSLF